MHRWLMVAAPLLLLIPVTFAAYCGTSSIPYSLEVLQDGTTVLGCARPTTGCFGWDPITGDPASRDQMFQTSPGGQPDGFDRAGESRILPFLQQMQQTAVCMASAQGPCGSDQWTGGIYSQAGDGITVACCTYPPLFNSEDRGIASLHHGEIFIGGEMENSTFDYIQNVRKVYDANGQFERYDVSVRRFGCVSPQPMPTPEQLTALPQPPVVQQQVYQPVAQPSYSGACPGCSSYYYPAGASQMQCFAADSKVKLQNGSIVRMDELDASLSSWVKSPNYNTAVMINVPLIGWLHREPKEEAEFLVITTEFGKTVKITRDHYIHRAECTSHESIRPTEMIIAGKLLVGDCLMEEVDGTETLSVTKIADIKTVLERGIYAPLSDKGNLMVDGIAVSCHSEAEDNTIVQTVFSKLITCKPEDNSYRCNFEKSTMTLLLEMMRLVVPRTMFKIVF